MSASPCCPSCRTALQPSQGEGVLVCAGCGGTFCAIEALKRLMAQAYQSLAQGAYQRRPIELGMPVHYLHCPLCSELMLRHNFGDSSGVIVDVCGKHGVWFDNGELAQALSFCASGQPQALQTLEKYQMQALRRINAPPLHFEDTSQKRQPEQTLGGILLDILWAVLSLYFP